MPRWDRSSSFGLIRSPLPILPYEQEIILKSQASQVHHPLVENSEEEASGFRSSSNGCDRCPSYGPEVDIGSSSGSLGRETRCPHHVTSLFDFTSLFPPYFYTQLPQGEVRLFPSAVRLSATLHKKQYDSLSSIVRSVETAAVADATPTAGSVFTPQASIHDADVQNSHP